MRVTEKKKRKPILLHAWEMAWDDPKLLGALLKKVIPDLQHQTGDARPVAIQIIYNHAQLLQKQESPQESNQLETNA